MSGCICLVRLPTGSASVIRCRQRSRRAVNGLPVHDRGKVLTQAMLMLAGGGEACADIEHLRAQPDLVRGGAVGLDAVSHVPPHRRRHARGLRDAFGEVRTKAWRRMAATTGTAPVVLDIDASLHEVHSENKDETAPHYKGGFGFHPIYCFADATGECLAELLRPGNAGANTIADHVAVLDAAIAQLPAEIAVGHRAGDDPALVRRAIQVRTDSAGCTDFVWRCRERNVGFAVIARKHDQVHAAICRAIGDEARWQRALTQDGEERRGAAGGRAHRPRRPVRLAAGHTADRAP